MTQGEAAASRQLWESLGVAGLSILGIPPGHYIVAYADEHACWAETNFAEAVAGIAELHRMQRVSADLRQIFQGTKGE